jgi:hypothetical protein
MKSAVILIACAIPLAACGSEPDVDVRNASVEEVADQVADASRKEEFFVRPGKWRSTIAFEEISAPNMPPQVAEQMRQSMAGRQTNESCLTPADAKRPREDFFTGADKSCRYDHFRMGNGKIDAKMRCSQGDTNQLMEMAGTYSLDRYSMRMTTTMQGMPGPAGSMRMRMRVDAERVGECDGKEA